MPERRERSIEEHHVTRESGSGCPEVDGGSHYFAYLDPMSDGRICIDCGTPESEKNGEHQ